MLATAPIPTQTPAYLARPLKVFCRNGHELRAGNVLWQKVRGPHHKRESYPVCRLCRRFSQADYAERQAAKRRRGHREGVLAVGG